MTDSDRTPAKRPPDRSSISPLPTWLIAAGVLFVAAVGLGVWLWLSRISGLQNLPLRIEAGKAALTATAGAAAFLGLLLAFRRQQSNDKFNRHEMHDAAEQRITELYSKAADQLGHDNPSVRLAGLYALRRLAHEHPAQQPAILSVLCAYLRMPFAAERPQQQSNGWDPVVEVRQSGWDSESRVRQAVLDVLTESQWEGADEPPNGPYRPLLDLRGATLDNIFINHKTVHLRLDDATVTGSAQFLGTTFRGLNLMNAHFMGEHGIHVAHVEILEYFAVDGMILDNDGRAYRYDGVTPVGKETNDFYEAMNRHPKVTYYEMEGRPVPPGER